MVRRHFFLRHGFFYSASRSQPTPFLSITFGARRADKGCEGGRRAEDPFRGLRAGPARSSPRLICGTPRNNFYGLSQAPFYIRVYTRTCLRLRAKSIPGG